MGVLDISSGMKKGKDKNDSKGTVSETPTLAEIVKAL
jgi:hypothetical protein